MSAPLFVLTLWGLALTSDAPAGDSAKKVLSQSVVKELAAQDVRFPKGAGDVTRPLVIASAEDLAGSVPDVRGRLKKEVDFASQKVLLFVWSGSGCDLLTFTVEKGDVGNKVVFRYDPGLTDDLRPHVRLFAVPRGATWTVLPGLIRG